MAAVLEPCALDDLLDPADALRDESGTLEPIRNVLCRLNPLFLFLAEYHGNLVLAEQHGGSVSIRSASALATRLIENLDGGGVAIVEHAADEMGFGVGLMVGSERRLLGGLVKHHPNAADEIREKAPMLQAVGEVVWQLHQARLVETNLMTRIRHLLAERDTLKASHSEVMSKVVEEHHKHVYEREHRLALEKLYRAAEATSHAKSEFLANMSHELRTPLHGILSFASFGMKKIQTANRDQLREYFAKIERSGTNLLMLINDLLDLSKLESGRATYDFKTLGLPRLINMVIDEVSTIAEGRGIRLQPPVEYPVQALVGDEGKLAQVLRNLFSNAIRFSPDGGVIEVDAVPADGLLRVSVSDHGCGIPESELEKVFDRFVQSSKTRTGAGGTGLGLAICREIIRVHQGRIWAENREGGGAVVAFEIPYDLKPAVVCDDSPDSLGMQLAEAKAEAKAAADADPSLS